MNRVERMIDSFIQRIRDDPERQKTKISVGDDPENPTYWRWFVWPRNPFFNCYLHNFLQDDAHDLHDHRMVNISFILQGSYFEQRFAWEPQTGLLLPWIDRRFWPTYSVIFRLPSWPHRVVLPRDANNRPIPSWSLFLGFPHWRNWGFWIVENGAAKWIPHQDYTESSDPTNPDYGRRKIR